jgi:hypothetical protein
VKFGNLVYYSVTLTQHVTGGETPRFSTISSWELLSVFCTV